MENLEITEDERIFGHNRASFLNSFEERGGDEYTGLLFKYVTKWRRGMPKSHSCIRLHKLCLFQVFLEGKMFKFHIDQIKLEAKRIIEKGFSIRAICCRFLLIVHSRRIFQTS